MRIRRGQSCSHHHFVRASLSAAEESRSGDIAVELHEHAACVHPFLKLTFFLVYSRVKFWRSTRADETNTSLPFLPMAHSFLVYSELQAEVSHTNSPIGVFHWPFADDLLYFALAFTASTSDATSGVDTTAILASLPPGLGQAASALTSFASSFKRANNQGQEREGVEGATGGEVDGTVDGDSKELKQSDSQHQQQSYDAQHGQHDVQHENQHDDQQSQQEQQQQQQQSHHEDDEQHQQQQQHQQQSVDRYGDATAAALAAMESLAAQGGLSAPMNHRQGRQKRELGPEAERLRKDNHVSSHTLQ